MTVSHGGQASLRGYRYQLLQSLDAWIGLRPNEILWLETEEDFSIASPTSAVDTQVKSSAAAAGPKPHSLHFKGVRAALERYWTRSEQGRNPRPHLAFIAKGGAAREQGLTFPNDVAGIDYWRTAIIDADTAPIRTALASVFEGEPIGEWINGNPSDEELRARLLSRVRWMLAALDEGPLTDLLRDKIAELYLTKGFLVTLADEAVRGLLDRVFEAACEPNPDDRRLTALDLHRSLELAAGPSAALQASARAISGTAIDAVPDGLFIARIGPPTGSVTNRRATVEEIVTRIRGEPLVWLHGAHGVGKSTLARLIASRTGGPWLVLDLRSVQEDAKATLAAWRELVRATLREPKIAGVVIDDVVGPAFEILRTRLPAFIASGASRGTRVIVTSTYEPSAARLAELGASVSAAIQAPYFTEEDVRALVTVRNGPPEEMVEGWALLILMTSNGGHPLLVAAKVASLRSRAWPASALSEDIGPLASEAVQATREEARRRLVDEVPSPEARQLLRRLGCVFDRADDRLILKLVQDTPPISNGGDALAVLRGSWIEVMPGGDLRLSPLIADIGKDVPEPEVIQHRRTAAEHWLGDGTLDQRTLPLCFWNALWGKHAAILLLICKVLETLPDDQIRGAAALLSPMTFLRTDTSIYPELPVVGAMLRLLQVEVADALEDGDTGRGAALRLMSEIEAIDHEELRELSMSVAIPKVLLAQHVILVPAIQLDWAVRLRAVLQAIIAKNNPALSRATAWLTTGLPAGVDLPGFLFSVIVTRIRSSARMLEMMEALDSLNENDRNSFLDAARIALGMGGGAFVHNGWAQEQLDNVDLRPALERYERMSQITRRWNQTDIQTELTCARSVILDEGLNDRSTAIAIVDDAISELGSTPGLVRQKAKVLGHTGDDAAAARLLMSIEDAVGADSPIDRALALRDGGVSAARAELFSDAVRLFLKAHQVLMNEGQHPGLAVGIQVEIALARWAINDRPGALVVLADALDAVETLDPATSRQSERAHQFARATIGLFLHKLDPYHSGQSRSIPFGQASALTGDESLLGIDLKPLAYNWRILALCEIEIGEDLGIDRRSMAKQTDGALASVEMFIAMARYSQAVASKDIAATLRLGLLAVSGYRVVQKVRAAGTEDAALDPRQTESKALQMLLEGGLSDIIRTIPVDLLIAYRFGGDWDPELVSRIETACVEVWGDTAPISDILRAASGRAVEGNPSASVALAASLASPSDLRGNPRARFDRDLLFITHMAHSLARRVLEPLVVTHIVDGWAKVLQDETFALRSPLQHVPEIQASIDDTKSSGLRGAARLMLAAAPAVRASLSEAWTQVLCQISGDVSPATEAQRDA